MQHSDKEKDKKVSEYKRALQKVPRYRFLLENNHLFFKKEDYFQNIKKIQPFLHLGEAVFFMK
ncbi:hypothetical protein ACFPYN_13910 [Paenisporosarcina macmurdoensis]|uniref:Uncharacterized protein n=1 Tax=Paenisporosarcina macmurdoensis TaxID=212659 RepID=A0ABW1LA08_9BACL